MGFKEAVYLRYNEKNPRFSTHFGMWDLGKKTVVLSLALTEDFRYKLGKPIGVNMKYGANPTYVYEFDKPISKMSGEDLFPLLFVHDKVLRGGDINKAQPVFDWWFHHSLEKPYEKIWRRGFR